MATNTCVVSGVVQSVDGQALPLVNVKAYANAPFFQADGTEVLPFQILVQSDVNGAWSMTLMETTTAAVTITFAFDYPNGSGGYYRTEYTVMIPDAPTANFSTLVTGV